MLQRARGVHVRVELVSAVDEQRAAAAEVRELERHWIRFVTELARNEYLVRTLLARHQATGDGTCAACTLPGAHGAVEWPCGVYRMAEAARRIARTSAERAAEPKPDAVVVDGPNVARPIRDAWAETANADAALESRGDASLKP